VIKLLGRQWPVAGGHRAQHLCVEFDLVQCHPVVDAKIELLGHRATSSPE
jgi:hypothetical protein